MPTPHRELGVAGAAAGSNGRVYVVGGYLQFGRSSVVTYEYDPISNDWTQVAPLPAGLDSHGVAVVNVGGQEHLYAVAGESFTPSGEFLDLSV